MGLSTACAHVRVVYPVTTGGRKTVGYLNGAEKGVCEIHMFVSDSRI